tara:strand:+ start:557 stop:904 length:348 start_codon:yes stop_codon:yes gene_type:complete
MKRIVLLLPLFLITMCGEAPVTPPAQACSLPLDGSPANCPTTLDDIKPKPLIPTQNAKGEIDVWNPTHFIQMQQMFERNKQIAEIEKNATKPSDAINSALDNFWEKQDGSNGSTK